MSNVCLLTEELCRRECNKLSGCALQPSTPYTMIHQDPRPMRQNTFPNQTRREHGLSDRAVSWSGWLTPSIARTGRYLVDGAKRTGFGPASMNGYSEAGPPGR